MKTKKLLLLAILVIATSTIFSQKSIYDFKVNDINGKSVNLKKYASKVILVVNTASKCGLTPQYEGLEELYKTIGSKDFTVLGFPCNQFLGQEPGTSEEILYFCTNKYNITFPIFEKIEVNGDNTHPLYVFLKQQNPLEGKNDIRWNFEKFLIDKNGNVVNRYSPKTKPADIKADIENLLKE